MVGHQKPYLNRLQQKAALVAPLFPKQGVGGCARAVVNGSYHGQVGTSTFQPVVAAAVHLEQHPLLGIPLSAVAVLRPPAPPGPSDSCLGEDAP